MSDGAIVIRKLGMTTPLGLTSASTQMAVAAGLAHFEETEVTAHAEPIRAARLTTLAADATRTERMVSLATTALVDCLRDLGRHRPEPIPCFLGLPERDVENPIDTRSLLLSLQQSGQKWPLDWHPKTHYGGRAAFFQALHDAVDGIRAGHIHTALVGSVDSLCDPDSLRLFSQRGRLLSPTQLDGIIPGEGAGFLLVTRAHGSGLEHHPQLGRVTHCALSHDSQPWHERVATAATGLTQLFRELRQSSGGRIRMHHIFSGQPGEGFWGRELTVAYLRNTALMPEPFTFTYIAESMGDIGAAAGSVQLSIALHQLAISARRGIPKRRALVYGSSDGGQHGGAIVQL